MRRPYSTLFDPEASEEQVKEARDKILEEVAEAEHERDDTGDLYDVWKNLHEATEKALQKGDSELHDYLKNNWDILKLHAEEELQP